MQDPRPLKNKQYMDQSILRLIHYLESHDYPHKQISIESLQSPSNKDFFQIFEFVMQSIDRDFRLKEEQPLEQIPPLLKSLGYPFIIPKSYLTSAGTPHTWPLLLGALSWIRELIEFEEVFIYLFIYVKRGHLSKYIILSLTYDIS
jgi:kinetochore protein NDC80